MNRRTFLSIVCGLLVLLSCRTQAFGQDPKIDELRQRYTWGSIYFAYDPICDLIYDLKDPQRRAAISSINGATLLAEFLKRNTSDERVKSISFLQINLQTLSAGYMKANDRDGVIKPLQWSKDQVRDIAILCDRLLTVGIAFEKFKDLMLSGNVGLTEAWLNIKAISRDVFVPAEKLALLFVAYGTLLHLTPVKKDAIGTSVNTLTELRQEFDRVIQNSNGLWSENLMYKYYENPQNNPLSEKLKTDNRIAFEIMDKTPEVFELRNPKKNAESLVKAYNNQLTLAWRQDFAKYEQAQNSKILALLAKIYLSENKFPEAQAYAERALKLDSNRPELFTVIGKIYLATGKTDLAITALKTALARDDQFIEAHLVLARILLTRGERRQAVEHINKVLLLEPENPQATQLRQQLASKP